MKKSILAITLIFIFCSCGHMVNYEVENAEIELKNKQLEYLEKLYRVRENIEFKEKRRVLDSLVSEHEKIN